MAWNPVTIQDVLTEFTPSERQSIITIQNQDSLQAILNKVVLRMRGKIKAGGNQLDMTGQTIPDDLQEECIALTRWRWLVSIPSLKMLQTKERADAAKAADDLLNKISSNDPDRPRTELPAVVDSTPAPVGGVQSQADCRQGTRQKLNGLI